MLPFISAYDPLGGLSGSIDPLGALQSYGLLADLLLPGVTTITTRSRYLSMLCAAIANVEQNQHVAPGIAGLSQRRLCVEPYERLWALACVAAREAGKVDAASGLRGVTYAENRYRQLVNNGKSFSPDFKLLKYQGRTGAVGTYWTALMGGQLVDLTTGALTWEGQQLAQQFHAPPVPDAELRRLTDPSVAHRVALSFDALRNWADSCHLSGAGAAEKRLLVDSLTAEDRRDCMAQALADMVEEGSLPTLWDARALRRLQRQFARIPRAEVLGLPTVVEAIIVAEAFHEAVLVAFETLLWWGTINAHLPVTELYSDVEFQAGEDRAKEAAERFLAFQRTCVRPDVCAALTSFASFSQSVLQSYSTATFVRSLMEHHHRVQSGKVDGGAPKRDWITGDGARFLRPSPRFQRAERPKRASGRALTHPYRIEQFAYLLQENGGLRAAA